MCIDTSGIAPGRALFSLFSRSMRRQRERGGSGPKTTRAVAAMVEARVGGADKSRFSPRRESHARPTNLWGRPEREAWRAKIKAPAAAHTHWHCTEPEPSGWGLDSGAWSLPDPGGEGDGSRWCGRRLVTAGLLDEDHVGRRREQPLGKGHSSPVQFSRVVLAWLLARSESERSGLLTRA